MATVNLNWSPPTTRTSGRPLKPGDIAGYSVEASRDGGAFAKLVDSPADAVARVVADLGPGVWSFRVACFDKKNRVGEPAVGSVEVEDDTPPSAVINLTLSVSASLATVVR